MSRPWAFAGALAALLAGAAAAGSDLPEVRGGRMQIVDGSDLDTSLAALVKGSRGGVWVGWQAQAIPGAFQMCCRIPWRDGDALRGSGTLTPGHDIAPDEECALEGDDHWVQIRREERRPQHFLVLARLRHGAVERVRVASANCALRVEGELHVLEGVAGEQSVAWLAAQVEGTADEDSVRNPALTALALHDVAEGTEILLRLARQAASADLRSEALFWLGQKAGDKVAGAIQDAIARDPEAGVKRAAVFALAELEDRDGVALLIDLVRNHSSPVVREEALFWLAASDDPRALDLIEEILTG